MTDKLTAIERLETLLDEKDAEIDNLRAKLEAAERDVEGSAEGWSLPRKLPAEQTLPVPRLELVFEAEEEGRWYQKTIRYQMVYRHHLGHCVGVALGHTRSCGGDGAPPDITQSYNLPLRDGMHIVNEAKQLRLPAFAVCGDKVQKIEVT